MAMQRGILVSGRIHELGSGQPVAGAIVVYRPKQKKNPMFREDLFATGEYWELSAVSGADGSFRIPALPGQGQRAVFGDRDVRGRVLRARRAAACDPHAEPDRCGAPYGAPIECTLAGNRPSRPRSLLARPVRIENCRRRRAGRHDHRAPGGHAAWHHGGFCAAGLAAAWRRLGFAAGRGAAAGFGALTSTGGKRSGDADCWAYAAGIANGESSTVDVSHRRRRLPALRTEIMGRPRYDVSGTSQRTRSHHAVPPAR